MREDMSKLIVERARLNSGVQRKGRAKNLEDMPLHEGMRNAQSLRGNPKYFNENLAPLRRFLDRQVGRPWNKVYADIAAHLRVNSTVQQHVRDHLHDFVAVVARENISSNRGASPDGIWRQEFYVHPSTGLLCRTDKLKKAKARRRPKS
jgi:hypothetical protein